MSQSQNMPTLLYIMGAGRCGSTILNIILGAHPDIEAVGEIKTWPRHKGLPRDHDLKDEDYEFWGNVLKQYIKLEGFLPEFHQLERICRAIETPTKLIAHLFARISMEMSNDYYKHVSNLIFSIHNVSGKKVILDSSKSVARAYKLLMYPNFNVKVIHLIRDPRGTVWSFIKKDLEQKPKKPLRAIFDYITLNGASILIRYLFRDKVIKVKYEDLIRQPAGVVEQILDFVNLDHGNVIDMIESDAEFDVKHLIDGNRIRRNKTIKFNPDEAWKDNLAIVYRVLAALGLPVYNL